MGSPFAVQEVGLLVTVHVNCDELPGVILVGFAVSVTTGGGTGVTCTVTDAVEVSVMILAEPSIGVTVFELV
jgi:hypothetical protein